jgi:hypothetical protein
VFSYRGQTAKEEEEEARKQLESTYAERERERERKWMIHRGFSVDRLDYCCACVHKFYIDKYRQETRRKKNILSRRRRAARKQTFVSIEKTTRKARLFVD